MTGVIHDSNQSIWVFLPIPAWGGWELFGPDHGGDTTGGFIKSQVSISIKSLRGLVLSYTIWSEIRPDELGSESNEIVVE